MGYEEIPRSIEQTRGCVISGGECALGSECDHGEFEVREEEGCCVWRAVPLAVGFWTSNALAMTLCIFTDELIYLKIPIRIKIGDFSFYWILQTAASFH